MTPLDMENYPEVFEPAETDQVAKYLNHRRQLLEEFQKSPMPMRPLPLLPELKSSTEAGKKERAQQFLEWGIQGVANRERLVISKSDLQVIKAEVASLRKATAQVAAAKVSTVSFSLAATEKEESLLSRTSIKKTPRFTYQPSMGSSPTVTDPTSTSGLRPLQNSCRNFADVLQGMDSTRAQVDEEDDDPTSLFMRVTLEQTW